MFKIYQWVRIKKSGKKGVVLGIMPKPFSKKGGFVYFVVVQHGKRFFKDDDLIAYEEQSK